MSIVLTWIIAAAVTICILFRPFRIPEYIFAVAGAVLLVLTRLLSVSEAWRGVEEGLDVYLFLTGMMLLAETAREEKLFDWLAAKATQFAKGSANRLFFLIYCVGTLVTIFLSNDATAVVLTPAVAVAVKAAKIEKPLPYLFICAFIANAASFVLPISNPANLVIYGAHMPALLPWLASYTLPSIASILVTFLLLRFSQRKNLQATIEKNIRIPNLSVGGKTAAIGIGITAVLLLLASAFDQPLGLPTAIAGIGTAIAILVRTGNHPGKLLNQVSWSVIPLVAGLFVLVEGLSKTGLMQDLRQLLEGQAANNVDATAWCSGLLLGFGSNITNNLPSGLIAGHTLQLATTPDIIKRSVLIGIDLGPNLSITGSLATLLWMVTLKREGIQMTAWTFLKLGFVVMTPALLCALAALWF